MEGPPRQKCRLSCKLDVKLARSASLEGGRAGKEPNTKICLDGSCLRSQNQGCRGGLYFPNLVVWEDVAVEGANQNGSLLRTQSHSSGPVASHGSGIGSQSKAKGRGA